MNITTTLPLLLAVAVAACDPSPFGPSPAGPALEMRDLPQQQHGAPPAAVAAYVGDEYADAQRALRDRPDEPASPTF